MSSLQPLITSNYAYNLPHALSCTQVYEKFINGYFTLHRRQGDGMGEKATAGTPSGRDRVCAIGSELGGEEEGEREWELKQVNHRRCLPFESPWIARLFVCVRERVCVCVCVRVCVCACV
jgi:hypothetical protein